MTTSNGSAIHLGEEVELAQGGVEVLGPLKEENLADRSGDQLPLRSVQGNGAVDSLPAPPSPTLGLDFTTLDFSLNSLATTALSLDTASPPPAQHSSSPLETGFDIFSPTHIDIPTSCITNQPNTPPPPVEPISSVPSPLTRSPNRSTTSETITPFSHGRSTTLLSPPLPSSNPLTTVDDVVVPKHLQDGIPMLKVSAKKVKQMVFRLDGEEGTLKWPSKKGGVVNIESIRELRLSSAARSFIDQCSLPPSHSSRWITIIYTTISPSSPSPSPSNPSFPISSILLPSVANSTSLKWKTLHLVALSPQSFTDFSQTLQALWEGRKELMGGIGGLDGFDEGATEGVGGLGGKDDGKGTEEKRKAIWMRKQWREAEVAGEVKKEGGIVKPCEGNEKDGWLDFEGVLGVCRRLNIASSRRDLLQRFQEADIDRQGHLDFVSFQRFVKELKRRPEVENLFAQLTPGEGLDEKAFAKFMTETQKCSLSPTELSKLFHRYAASPPATSQSQRGTNSYLLPPAPPSDPDLADSTSAEPGQIKPIIHLDAFLSFLTSPSSPISSSHPTRISHDMTRPLAEYFVSSSHNTYLIGHQLVGESTVEGYIRALLQGCRSVELDIWDGDSVSLEPQIYHGRTFTSKVSVRAVIHAIGKYAFVASPYPVILSAEIHCGVEQQDRLVQILEEVLGDKFLGKKLDGWEEGEEELPSPEMLKYKILLKAKIPKHKDTESSSGTEAVLSTESESTNTSSDNDLVRRASGFVSRVRRHLGSSSSSDTSAPPQSIDQISLNPTTPLPRAGTSSSFGSNSSHQSNLSTPRRLPKPKFSLSLSSVLPYTLGVPYRGFNKKETYAASHMVSLSERTANKLLKERDGPGGIVKHSRGRMVRLYPSVTRLTSSNFDPVRYWGVGVQIVAINWQSCDLGYTLNGAMFARNGRSGFVLKPEPLRIKMKEENIRRIKHVLTIKIISAQQLPPLPSSNNILSSFISPDKNLDPYVSLSLHAPTSPPTSSSTPSLPSSTPRVSSTPILRTKTRSIADNGFDPVWNESRTLSWVGAEGMDDLAFVRFEVRHDPSAGVAGGDVGGDGDEGSVVAGYCISVGSLNQGYRHIPLQDQHLNQFLFSSLFVHVDLKSTPI